MLDYLNRPMLDMSQSWLFNHVLWSLAEQIRGTASGHITSYDAAFLLSLHNSCQVIEFTEVSGTLFFFSILHVCALPLILSTSHKIARHPFSRVRLRACSRPRQWPPRLSSSLSTPTLARPDPSPTALLSLPLPFPPYPLPPLPRTLSPHSAQLPAV